MREHGRTPREAHRRPRLASAALGATLLAWLLPVPFSLAGSLPEGSTPSQLDDAGLEELLRMQHTETESVRVVLIPASVQDRRRRIVKNLTREDFRLFDESVRRPIDYFSVEADQSIEIAFLLDVSGSMRQLGKIEAAKEAIHHLVDSLRPQDRFALICFADKQVSWVTEFTSDRERFLERLAVQEGYGRTALHDAVAATPGLVDLRTRGRKAIVLITDGVDNNSRLSIGEAVWKARRVQVPIYTVGFSSIPEGSLPKGRTPSNLRVLDLFSSETGGELFVVFDPDDLKDSVARIDEELRYQYVIGYRPPRDQLDGRFRRLRIEVERGGLEVHARKGYYATP